MSLKIRKNRVNPNKEYIKVKHPDFGYVEFRGMTRRQMDVLLEYKNMFSDDKTNKKN